MEFGQIMTQIILPILVLAGATFGFAFMLYRSLRDKIDDRENGIFKRIYEGNEELWRKHDEHGGKISDTERHVAVHEQRLDTHEKELKKLDTSKGGS